MEGSKAASGKKILLFVGQFALIVAGVWAGTWLWNQSQKPRTSPPATAPQ